MNEHLQCIILLKTIFHPRCVTKSCFKDVQLISGMWNVILQNYAPYALELRHVLMSLCWSTRLKALLNCYVLDYRFNKVGLWLRLKPRSSLLINTPNTRTHQIQVHSWFVTPRFYQFKLGAIIRTVSSNKFHILEISLRFFNFIHIQSIQSLEAKSS